MEKQNLSELFYITGSKVECYAMCPQKYYLTHVRNINKKPFKPSPLLAFDQSIHKALSSFYKFHNKEELFDFNKLLKSLNYNWNASNYENSTQSEEYKVTAANVLKTYFETYCKQKDLHADVDNFFKAELNNTLYGGKIDRIDINPDGSLEIIDYKTGKMPIGGIDELSNSLTTQLLFAACDVLWPNKVKQLTFIYLKTNQSLIIKRDSTKIEEALKRLSNIIDSIKNDEFPAKASGACSFCDFKNQCPEGQKVNLTPAKLRLYIECPQKFSFKYIDKVQINNNNTNNSSLLFYNYITSMLFNIYKEQKIYDTEKLEKHAKNAINHNSELTPETKEEILEYCSKSFTYINDIITKSGFPLTAELRPELKMTEDNILLSGRVDRIDKSDSGKVKLVIYKTSKQASTISELENDLSSAFYWKLGREAYKDDLDSIEYIYLVPGITHNVIPSNEAITLLEENISNFLKENAFKGCKGSLCSWCDYYSCCPDWKIKPHELANETQEEFRKRLRLSYSKMSLYLNCPRSYKKVYVDGIKSKPQPYFDFGTAIHETFENIYNPECNRTNAPSLEELISEYEKVRVKYRSGMLTPEIEEQYHQDGIRQLTLYYNHFIKDKDFKSAHAIEEYFEIPCGKYAVMTGFIDRIDKLHDGSYEILDYKTEPTLRSQEEVDADKQLSIYYMAAEQTLNLKISKLSLLMLDHDKKIETTRKSEDIPDVIETIDKTAYQILHETEFLPKKNKYCKSCDYLDDCPLKQQILEDDELISMQKFSSETV